MSSMGRMCNKGRHFYKIHKSEIQWILVYVSQGWVGLPSWMDDISYTCFGQICTSQVVTKFGRNIFPLHCADTFDAVFVEFHALNRG